MGKNVDLKINDNKLAEFSLLTSLGVKNACTYSNIEWGNMALENQAKTEENYPKLFERMEIETEEFLYISAEHNDNVRLVDASNFKFYKHFNISEKFAWKLKPVLLRCDVIITKEPVPIVVTPADCNVIIITGIDKKDSKRFVMVVHSGIFGTMLNVVGKSVTTALKEFDTLPQNMQAFVFPGVGKGRYIKSKTDPLRGHLVSEKDWASFVTDLGKSFSIDIQGKIIEQLNTCGVDDISYTNLDTYQENISGNLFSYTYAKEKEVNSANFAVCVSL